MCRNRTYTPFFRAIFDGCFLTPPPLWWGERNGGRIFSRFCKLSPMVQRNHVKQQRRTFFGKSEKEYLSFWVTCDGVKPTKRKIVAITNIAPPTSQKLLRNFIGVQKYYHYVWPRRSHTLAPLTKLMSIIRNFLWTQVKQDDFYKINWIMASHNLLGYPGFNNIHNPDQY